MNTEVVIHQLIKRVEYLERRKIYQQDLTPDCVKQEHVFDSLIKMGLSTNIPDGSTKTKAYFSTDTGELSIWDGTQWLTVTLT